VSKNQLCKVLGIKKPVIQGPMAWVSTAPLAAAVSEAGGLGVLGVGFAPIDVMISQIEDTKKLTNQPFGINVVMIPEMLDAVTEVALKEKPPVIYADTVLGLDVNLCKKYFGIWHNGGMKIIVKASTLDDAVIAEAGGADVVIVKGWEGGGHVTFEATTVLVPQAADRLSIPVVASGGIADGRGMAAAVALGADGFEMGTVFLACSEGTIPEAAKQAVVNAKDMENVITGLSTGEPCRQIKNKLSDELLQIERTYLAAEAAEKMKDVAEGSLKKAMLEGDVENGAVMAGQIAPLVTSIRPVAEIIDTALEECRQVLQNMTQFNF